MFTLAHWKPSSETLGQSVGPGEKALQKFSSTSGKAPGYRVSPDHFQTVKFLRFWLGKLGERTGQLWRDNSRRVRTHEKNSGDAVCRLGTIIQSIFCAQSGASILLSVWKWSVESRYSGAFPPVLEDCRRAFSPGPTDRPWVPTLTGPFPNGQANAGS